MTHDANPARSAWPESRELHPVLNAAAMRAADLITIETLGIPGFTLMEMAGREAARIADSMLQGPSRVLVCCGKGNNGGDGLVVARWLADAGHTVAVRITAEANELSADAAANLAILEKLPDEVAVDIRTGWAPPFDLPASDLIVDALFGTGLTAALRHPYDTLVAAMNGHGAPILSLDIPSGLSADSGLTPGACVRADATVTMGALKHGLLLGDGPDVCGTVHVADIGIPSSVLRENARGAGGAFLSTDSWAARHLRPRTRHDHKYTTGPALIAGGSTEFPGAPVLASRAAARIGSGYVVAAGPESIRSMLIEKLDAIPVASWTGADAEKLIRDLGARWDKARSLLIGPGLGRDAGARELVWGLLSAFEGPVVLDADALFAVASDRERVAEASGGRWILTPHEGEASRLDNDTDAPASRVERALALARDWNCVVLFKGQPSVTASPDGRVIINATGHPAAATAGTGDVLAGIVTGLLAQGLEPFVAAAAGIHIGGTAAARFVERGPSQSLVAADIIEALPDVLRQLS